MRIIAGDIGGTKTLLQFVDRGSVVAEQRFESGHYPTFNALLAEFIPRIERPIDTACFAVAGPVIEQRAEITNLGWRMDARELGSAFGIRHVALINDFYAVALGVPLLTPTERLSLNAGNRHITEPIAILGAGTGLGQAMLVSQAGQWNVIPSEGGHADFAPQDEQQMRLLVFLQQKYGHVSWERLISGMGLVNIFTFLGGPATAKPSEVATLAEGNDPLALETLRIFIDIYGSEAGNMALRMLARGGVFLAGGIAAKNARFFTDGRFMDAFLRKGRFSELLKAIPVDIIMDQKVGLRGAAEMARRIATMNDER
jgi:glucokinase